MKTTPAFGGENPCVRAGELDGESVLYVPLSDGQEVIVSANRWTRYLKNHFTTQLSHDSSGNGHSYPRLMAYDPSPDAMRSRVTTLARLLVADRLVEEEMAGGEPAPAKGWVVRHKNGDTLDCRDENLLCVPADGRRNGIRAVWNVRERAKLVALGLNPNVVFAQRRKVAREERHRAEAECAGNLRPDLSEAMRTRVVDGFPPLGSPDGRGGGPPGGDGWLPAIVSTANGGER